MEEEQSLEANELGQAPTETVADAALGMSLGTAQTCLTQKLG
jgi:hypothetical protein